MQDPKPENISGQKVQRHTFKHEINWSYLALALALVYIAWVVNERLDLSSSSDNLDSSAEEIEIEDVEDATGLTS